MMMNSIKNIFKFPLSLILFFLICYSYYIPSAASEMPEYTLNSSMTTLTTGIYYVYGRITIPERIIINGDVTIYLNNGSQLNTPNGISVLNDNKLTLDSDLKSDYHNSSTHTHIYMGKLTAGTSDGNAAIGAGITPDGNIQTCGTIVINGGNITATGGDNAAGIGGSHDQSSGTIEINDGKITAAGGLGGIAGTSLAINGGSVATANYDNSESAVSDPGTIVSNILDINSGNVTAHEISGGRFIISGGVITIEDRISGDIVSVNDGMISASQFYSYTYTESTLEVNGGYITLKDNILFPDVIITDGILSCSGISSIHPFILGNLAISGGTVTSNGPINMTNSALPAEYIYWIGMNADGSDASQHSFPDTSFVNNGYQYIKIAGPTTLTEYTNVLSTGKYISKNYIEIAERIEINGDVTLFLEDRTYLNAINGIHVPAGSSLTIDAQSDGDDMGQLIASPTGGEIRAGIGGNENEVAGAIIINGGDINVKGGGYSSGIGRAYRGSGGSLTINGGRVKTLPSDTWLTFEISGIYVDTLVITGGLVEAAGGVRGNIGYPLDPGGGRPDLGYPPGYENQSSQSAIRADSITLPATYSYWTDDDREADKAIRRSFPEIAFINDTNIRYFKLEPYDPSQDTVIPLTSTMTELISGDYLVEGSLHIDSRITVHGNVSITLAEDAHLNAAGGINVGDSNSLTIDAPETARITATGGSTYAGIGGKSYESAGRITINGGMVHATGGDHAAGIGGGYTGSGGEIIINDGTVTSIGGRNSAGIGGGAYGNGGAITINGGTVTAEGSSEYAAGIGGGWTGGGGTVIINGGTVIAEGGANSAGIGNGLHGNGAMLTVSGGTVTASGIIAVRADIASLPDQFAFRTSTDMNGQDAIETISPETAFINDSSYKYIKIVS